MPTRLPQLHGSPSHVAQATEIRERLLGVLDEANKKLSDALEKSHSDTWPALMQTDADLNGALIYLTSQSDACWWASRRSASLSAIVRESIRDSPQNGG